MSDKEVSDIAFKADIKFYAIVDHPNIFTKDGLSQDIEKNKINLLLKGFMEFVNLS